MVDLDAASQFMAGHARLLDRRRFDVIHRGAPADGALAALSAYSNPDGGYGWGLEADLRAPESQPGGALHALEVFEDILPATSPRALELCDWLGSASLPDGGLPFALPVSDPAACAPFWASADPTRSSLQITAVVAAVARRVGAGDPAVAGHPWLAAATRYCLDAIAALGDEPHALVLAFAVRFLDTFPHDHPEAGDLLERLGRHIPTDGLVHVGGGLDDEFMRPLDFAPDPGRPARSLFADDVVAADLERFAGLQQDDGGWPCEFANYSAAATLDWRGHLTVRALSVLRSNGVI
jgi:hypothetical protein